MNSKGRIESYALVYYISFFTNLYKRANEGKRFQ